MIENYVAPNWKNEAEYPAEKDTSAARWAWEFLRRNAKYQLDWQQYADAVLATAHKHPETLEYATRTLMCTEDEWEILGAKVSSKSELKSNKKHYSKIFCDRSELALWVYDPPLMDGETLKAYRDRVERYSYHHLSLKLGDDWGLSHIVSPRTNKVGFFGATFKNMLGWGWRLPEVDFRSGLAQVRVTPHQYLTAEKYAVDVIERLGEELGRPELITITFNLALPLDEQVKNARDHMKFEADARCDEGEIKLIPQPRYEARMYRDYLRAFDAKKAGAKPVDIVKALLPKEAETNNAGTGYSANAKIKTWVKQAEFLVETGYRFIPLAANKAAKTTRKKARS